MGGLGKAATVARWIGNPRILEGLAALGALGASTAVDQPAWARAGERQAKRQMAPSPNDGGLVQAAIRRQQAQMKAGGGQKRALEGE